MANVTVNLDSLKTNREYVRHKIQPNSNIYRILPPFGSVDDHNNYPYKKWRLAWLLDPQSNRRRPLAIPYVDGQKDPITEFVNSLTATIDQVKKDLEAKGVDANKIKDLTASAAELVWNMRPKTGYFYNAINKAGEVGILELKATAHRELKTAMMEYIKDYAQDPTSLGDQDDDSGVWFNIKRDGEKGSKDTKYSVAKHQIKMKVDGKITFTDDREALPDNVVQHYDSVGYDLYNLYSEKDYSTLQSILDYNIGILSKDIPLLKKVPGSASASAPKAAVAEEAPAEKPMPTKVQGKKPIAIAMDSDDGDDEEEAPKATPAPVAVAPKVSTPPAPTKTDLDDLDSLLSMLD